MMNASGFLAPMIAAQKRGSPRGIASVCSANAQVLDAAARLAAQQGSMLLVESTGNQVNQHGGYSGMAPAAFRDYATRIAAGAGLPEERLLLGGDHLGPGPWKKEGAALAMARAAELVQACVAAGYQKIHLDASMRCADDEAGRPLPAGVAATRTAELCGIAEEAWQARGIPGGAPRYVIGSEVPAPGGSSAGEGEPAVTGVEDAQDTLELARRAFLARGLGEAWERVIALVVQPGVDFGDERVYEYRRAAAAGLSHWIQGQDRLVFEVHSTDYQSRESLRQLVEDQFAILKVGPALTFALREALFALALVEEEWLGGDPALETSHLIERVERAMSEQPQYWQGYYRGSAAQVRMACKYSYSDRIRYYWPLPVLQEAIARLIENLQRHAPPVSLLSQYLPAQTAKIRSGELANEPEALIRDKIGAVLEDYAWATGTGGGEGCEEGCMVS